MEHTEVVKPKSLDELIKILHKIFESDSINVEEVQDIMEAYDSNPQDWMRYAKFDQYSTFDGCSKKSNRTWKNRYTRNLVDEGNGKFNLMILCWGEGHGSSIHDHTDSHCFMKLLQGQLKETLFEWPDNKSQGEMVQKSQRILQENKVAYINDSIGLHRVENGSHTECAASLHLYSPPFQSCQTFDQRTGHRNTVKMTFWSKKGERTPFETTFSQENN
ncbi:cysteine dioxygenase type 1 isoform X1 [Etheostoma cragini]|uniref:cysteine dioxygenase type 1 isoform X1 n=1 Tax=Etheostoma cragini TaxID=417921 RepID=UPI00155E09EF|nr:cysteine dioxygenase type 1 isoform X1 [Etheostoma cragini]